jgi:hypothetical protein
VRLVRSEAEGWALMPFALERVRAFVSQHDPDSDPLTVMNAVTASFTSGNEALGLWMLVDDERIYGHMLCVMQESKELKRRWACGFQGAFDHPVPRDVRAEGFAIVRDWALANGAQYVEAYTKHPERLWRQWGAKFHKTVIRWALP